MSIEKEIKTNYDIRVNKRCEKFHIEEVHMERVKVGIIGCGMISEIYLKNMTTVFQDVLEAYACADVIPEAAQKRAEQFQIKAMSVEELLKDEQVEVILNLTIPAAHYEISKKALLAGKHAYSEKPLASTLEEGKELLKLAQEKNLFVAAAPDTFLGGGLQTCRKILESGMIGEPVFAQGLMLACGPEHFHPNPAFFYKKGAGPLFDMGPYYLMAMVSLFGGAKRVAGMGRNISGTRTVLAKNSPQYGEKFTCEVDTFNSGSIEFESGVVANLTVSWDMNYFYWESEMPLLTVYGTEGTMILPDPNTFGGIGTHPNEPGKFVKVKQGNEKFKEVPVEFGYTENSRAIGLADMARCIRNGGTPRVCGENSLHVLELMLGFLESDKNGRYYELQSRGHKPEALYTNMTERK